MQKNSAPAVTTAANALEDRVGLLPAVLQSCGLLLDSHASTVASLARLVRYRLDFHQGNELSGRL
jgi:hypothetical protein